MNDLLRQLPSLDRLLAEPDVAALVDTHGHEQVVFFVRRALDDLRADILAENAGDMDAEALQARLLDDLQRGLRPSIRHAINAAGVILHTGLGRALMPEAAADAVADTIRGYCTLATDLEHGQRMTRDEHYRDLLCALTGAEAATVVVNNAAATMLILNTLARGQEVIVSRGQLVEIGGSFRMPDVMAMSGAILREVGTTNKTHLRDYERAIGENTGAILRVHQSNYRILGFTSEPDITELAELGRQQGLPVVDDLGSGALVDLRQFGFTPDPLVQDSVKAGATVSCFSGDKLIGGPQCGIIVGTREAIEQIKRNPLARALRIGKMTVAALEATLRLFLNEKELFSKHPTYRMFSLPPESLERRAQALLTLLGDVPADIADLSIEPGDTEIGSGTAAIEKLPSIVLSVRSRQMTADDLARRLRRHEPPIFTRIHDDAVIFDFRTIQPDEDEAVLQALQSILL
jgi:L-seryl-tRNA(Ser) seleniumtransferase